MDPNLEKFPFGVPKLSRRQEILRVASELFNQFGVGGVTTRQIAAKVGISQPSLYAHFKSVHQIHEELSSIAFEFLEQKTVVVEKEGLGKQELLRATIRNYFEFGMSNPVAYRIAFIIESNKDPVDQVEYEATDHPGVRAFKNLRNTVSQVRPDLEDHHILIVSKLLWATLHGLVSLFVTRAQFPWGDQNELIQAQSQAAFDFVMNYKVQA